ncbi:hypothetical protein ACIQU4_09520 [Streptomyces sp. NPDC090741]|uniref:hypothetical protein n=1 Tax=Streptomyces sp. NPDC090741 TaxID=3365967 RepID=UPI0038063DCF
MVFAAAGPPTPRDVIDRLPHGPDTRLARSWWGGRDPSGGQWQQLAIAGLAGRIIVPDRGRIAEQGDFASRIAAGALRCRRGRQCPWTHHRHRDAGRR